MMEFPSYYHDNNPFPQNYYPHLRRPSLDPRTAAPPSSPSFHDSFYNPYAAAPSSSSLFDDFFTTRTPPPQPIQRRMGNPRRYPSRKTTSHQQQEPRNVINIPVFGSDEKVVSRSDYATRIQKVFRGFRVRKNVRKIMELKRGIDSVEKKFSEKEYVELIKRSDFERLKVNEALMALLLKLDAVTSCNDAVKICRKAVVKKAILLQEKIDSFAVVETLDGGETSEDSIMSEDDAIIEEIVGNSTDCSDNADADSLEKLSVSEVEEEEETEAEKVVTDETSGGEVDSWDLLGDEKEVEFIDFGEKREGEAKWMIPPPVTDEWFVVDESKENKKLMEKLAADNKTLVATVADLCRKNAEQALLIDSLTRRVQLLEQRR